MFLTDKSYNLGGTVGACTCTLSSPTAGGDIATSWNVYWCSSVRCVSCNNILMVAIQVQVNYKRWACAVVILLIEINFNLL